MYNVRHRAMKFRWDIPWGKKSPEIQNAAGWPLISQSRINFQRWWRSTTHSRNGRLDAYAAQVMGTWSSKILPNNFSSDSLITTNPRSAFSSSIKLDLMIPSNLLSRTTSWVKKTDNEFECPVAVFANNDSLTSASKDNGAGRESRVDLANARMMDWSLVFDPSLTNLKIALKSQRDEINFIKFSIRFRINFEANIIKILT